MVTNIVPFPKSGGAVATPLGHFIRLGDSGVRAIGDLVAGGHLLPTRVVIDASRFSQQRDLIQDLKLRGVEIVLDPKIAELGSTALSGRRVRQLPWALQSDGALLGPDHFGPRANTDVIDAVARFCVANKIDAVLSPSHWLGDPACDDWLQRDAFSCNALRTALDREGGPGISIDFAVIAPHTMLREPAERAKIVDVIKDSAAENVWFRASGIKNGAAPLSTARHIEALAAYAKIDKPIVGDFIGGMTGLSLLAFGVVSGIAHGIGRHDGFDARGWHKAPRAKADDEEGTKSQKRVLLSDINRSLTAREVQWLAGARGGRRLISCSDRECCPHGLDDMLRDPRRHSARQIIKRFDDLEKVPDLKRAEHFIHGQLDEAARKARRVAKLRPEVKDDERAEEKVKSLVKRMEDNADILDKTRTALERLLNEQGANFSSPKRLRERQAQKGLFDRQSHR